MTFTSATHGPNHNADLREAVRRFTFDFAILQSINAPVSKSFEALIQTTEDARLKIILASVRDEVVTTGEITPAFEKFPEAFGRGYLALLKEAEEDGTLPEALASLAGFGEEDHGPNPRAHPELSRWAKAVAKNLKTASVIDALSQARSTTTGELNSTLLEIETRFKSDFVTLSDVFAAYPAVFDKVFVTMVGCANAVDESMEHEKEYLSTIFGALGYRYDPHLTREPSVVDQFEKELNQAESAGDITTGIARGLRMSLNSARTIGAIVRDHAKIDDEVLVFLNGHILEKANGTPVVGTTAEEQVVELLDAVSKLNLEPVFFEFSLIDSPESEEGVDVDWRSITFRRQKDEIDGERGGFNALMYSLKRES